MATILQIANADRNISLFSRGLKVSGLDNKLTEVGPFTMLAPVNLAVRKLNNLSYEVMLEPTNSEQLLSWLSDFIIVGKKKMVDFSNKQKLATLSGKQVVIDINSNGEILVNGAKILSRDRQGSNGVVHLLDSTYTMS